MRALSSVLALAFLLAVSVAGATPSGIDVQKIAEGVYVAVRAEPPGLMFNGNAVFVVNEADVVVVDTTITPTSARELVAAIRKVTDKPVRYVVNTHFHDDHVMGNQVFRDAFPGVDFVAHAWTREDMTTVGVANRKQLVDGAPPMVAEMKRLLGVNKSLGGWDLTPEERVSYASDIEQVERYLAEAPSFELVVPTITFEDRLVLRRGSRTIEVIHLGRGHSRGDVVVRLPDEGILISGDLVVWPVPLVGSTSYPRDYGATLEKMLELRPAIIVPGHGPVMRDDAYARLLVRLLRSLAEQAEAARARGETLEQARKSVNLDEFRRAIAGDSKLLGFVFDFYVRSPGITAAFNQAKG